MSKENLEQFMNQIADSEELQAKIGEQIDAAALIALGAECGCEFTAEELQDSAELSDDELDEVAGGAVIPDATTAPKYGGTNCGAGGAGALGGGLTACAGTCRQPPSQCPCAASTAISSSVLRCCCCVGYYRPACHLIQLVITQFSRVLQLLCGELTTTFSTKCN